MPVVSLPKLTAENSTVMATSDDVRFAIGGSFVSIAPNITDVPADFVNMVSLSATLEYRVVGRIDDTCNLSVLVTDQAQFTTFAGATSTAGAQVVNSNVTNIVDTTTTVNFNFVNTGVGRVAWNDGMLIIYNTITTSMGSDGASIEIDYFELTGTYESNLAPPSAVTNLAGTAGANQVGLTWSAPANNGSPITDYIVQRREVG